MLTDKRWRVKVMSFHYNYTREFVTRNGADNFAKRAASWDTVTVEEIK